VAPVGLRAPQESILRPRHASRARGQYQTLPLTLMRLLGPHFLENTMTNPTPSGQENPSIVLLDLFANVVKVQLSAMLINEAELMERSQSILKAALDHHYQMVCFIRRAVHEEAHAHAGELTMDGLFKKFNRLYPLPEVLKPTNLRDAFKE
jgi:hypothetical protein